MKSNHLRGHKNALIKCSSASFESLQQLHHLLNYTGCQQTAICNEGMFCTIMTTDGWRQTGYAFQFASGNNNNYSSCRSSLHYRIHFAAHIPLPTHQHPKKDHARPAREGQVAGQAVQLQLSYGRLSTFDTLPDFSLGRVIMSCSV